MSDKAEIFRSTYDELQNTLENQLEAHRRINQRAVDLAKINLLALSIIFAGVSISNLSISIPLVAGFVSLTYALWSCVKVYEPTPLVRGLGHESIDEIDDFARNGGDLADHYREMMYGFKNSVEKFSDIHPSNVEALRNGIWSSIVAIMFFVIVGLKTIGPTYPTEFDYIWIFVVPIVGLWGKDKYSEDNDSP